MCEIHTDTVNTKRSKWTSEQRGRVSREEPLDWGMFLKPKHVEKSWKIWGCLVWKKKRTWRALKAVLWQSLDLLLRPSDLKEEMKTQLPEFLRKQIFFSMWNFVTTRLVQGMNCLLRLQGYQRPLCRGLNKHLICKPPHSRILGGCLLCLGSSFSTNTLFLLSKLESFPNLMKYFLYLFPSPYWKYEKILIFYILLKLL